MDDPMSADRRREPRLAVAGGPAHPRWRRAAGWGALALVLALTFRAYLDPDLTLDLGAFLAFCGLR
jgi:hypothetical protein